MNNNSGKTFENAKIKLMAGDVNKIQPPAPVPMTRGRAMVAASFALDSFEAPAVTEKAFDEFHLYDISRETTLHDHETKQVEFVHAEKMFAPTIYVYDGAPNYRFYGGLNHNRTTDRATAKKSLSSASSGTRRRTSSASRCRRASCAFIGATVTASCSLSVKTQLTTRLATRPSA